MPPDPLSPNLRPDAFKGVAGDYLRHRLPYPRIVLDDLLARSRLPLKSARLIDLGCGPGRLTFAIADRFAEVVAIDLEPEMIEAGRQEAARRGVSQIDWRVGRAEMLQAPAGAFDLITAGEAFHRLDQPVVAAHALTWLRPGGALVTLGMDSFLEGDAPWRPLLAEVAIRWSGLGAAPPAATQVMMQEDVLRAAGFEDVANHVFKTPHVWSLDALLANLGTMSVLSRHALGARHADFEADLRATLLGFDPSGHYAETVRCGYTLARKPSR